MFHSILINILSILVAETIKTSIDYWATEQGVISVFCIIYFGKFQKVSPPQLDENQSTVCFIHRLQLRFI